MVRSRPPSLTLPRAGGRGKDDLHAVVVRGSRIESVGAWADLRSSFPRRGEIIDCGGAALIPAFHDAHIHLLSFARARSRIDCRPATTIDELCGLLSRKAAAAPENGWLRGFGYDETRLVERRHPDRSDLDRAAPRHLARLQHRTLHLDVLNTAALKALGLWDEPDPAIERDAITRLPTGRLYNAGELLRQRLSRPGVPQASRDHELDDDVAAASQYLLSRGITTVQDATFTNGLDQWELIGRLQATGALRARVVLFKGAAHWAEMEEISASYPLPPASRRAGRPDGFGTRGRPFDKLRMREGGRLGVPRSKGLLPRRLLGPVKFMLDERTTNPEELRNAVGKVRQAGHAVAFHAVSEAELVLALDALQFTDRPPRVGAPDRIEHGAVIPDAMVPMLIATGATVVGQPSLVGERGDIYQHEYGAELHGWLHRARSLIRHRIDYAASSDAPVTLPSPSLMLQAACRRQTPDGDVLGPGERLTARQALLAMTLGPARALGLQQTLGRIVPGAAADLAVIDQDVAEGRAGEDRPARLTVMDGEVVWRAG